MMRVAVAAAIGFGCAFIGWDLGLGVFAALFEALRSQDAESALDSPRMLVLFRYLFVAAGLLFGTWIGLRARPRQHLGPRAFLLGAIAGAGSGVAGSYLGEEIAGLGIRYLGMSKDAYILVSLVTVALLVLIGSALAARHLAGRGGALRFLLRAGAVAIASFALLFSGVAVNKWLVGPYARLGETTTAWMMIRFPAAVTTPPAKDTIRLALQTAQGRTDGAPTEWLDEGGRHMLRGYAELNRRTRDRVVILSVPGEPDRLFRMNFPSNPRVTDDYGDWQPVDLVGTVPGTPRRATKDDDFAIRYMIR